MNVGGLTEVGELYSVSDTQRAPLQRH
jgi:hypothetical protein